MSTDDEPNDPGLARERTVLASNRSGLAVVVCVAVVLRHLGPLSDTGESVALAIVAVAAIMWASASFALRVRGGDRSFGSSRRRRVFGLMTTATFLLALGGIALTIVTPRKAPTARGAGRQRTTSSRYGSGREGHRSLELTEWAARVSIPAPWD